MDRTADIKDRLKAPLADLKEAFDPTAKDRIVRNIPGNGYRTLIDVVSQAEGAGAAVKKAMEELRLANQSGDPERIRNALAALREALDRYFITSFIG